MEITVLANKTGNYRGGKWFFSVTDFDLRIPESLKAKVTASIQDETTLSGEILDIGNWTGGKRTAWYARYEFPLAERIFEGVRRGNNIHISGPSNLFEAFQILFDQQTVELIDHCLEEGNF
jgi:hypothetical protein